MATSLSRRLENPLCYALWAAFVWPFWLVRPEPYVGWLVLAPALVLTQRSVQPAVAAPPAIAGASAAVLGVVAALAITWMWRRPPGRA